MDQLNILFHNKMELDQINNIISPFYIIKIVVLGSVSVGKSTIIHLLNNKTLEEVAPTIGIGFSHKLVQLEEYPLSGTQPEYYYEYAKKNPKDLDLYQTVKVQIWDCAGADRFKQIIVKSYLRNSDIAFLVYDMCDRNTWLELEKWKKELDKNIQHKNLPLIVLIGNKSDMGPYEVTPKEIRERCEQWNAMSFINSCVTNTAHSFINRMLYKSVQYYHHILLDNLNKNLEIPSNTTLNHYRRKDRFIELEDDHEQPKFCCFQ